MKTYRLGAIFVYLAVAGAMVVCRPEWLTGNAFLRSFIGAELVAVLVVILTITSASVANIHLSLSRMEAALGAHHKQQIDRIRRSITQDAWVIFWSFLVCIAFLVVAGATDNEHLLALSYAISLLILLINVLVLHTIYRAIFGLVTLEGIAATRSADPGSSGGDSPG